jgi:hypothetical protein
MFVLQFTMVLIALFNSCNKKEPNLNWGLIKNKLNNGELTNVIKYSDSIQSTSKLYDYNWMKADSFKRIAKRILLDFRLDEKGVEKQLNERMGEYSIEEKQKWEDYKWLETKIIDGNKRYFKNAVSNLIRKKKRAENAMAADAFDNFRMDHITQGINETTEIGQPVKPCEFNIIYTITVDADAVSAGELVKCWMPWPKENHKRQGSVQLIKTSEKEYTIASDSFAQRSIYMEKPAVAGEKTVFKIKYKYVSSAQYFDPEKMVIKEYNKDSELYKEYTQEQKPHIIFSEKIRNLADSIVGNEKNPLEIVKKLYYWVDYNIPWASALEYSTISCIPEYCIDNMKGDCGIQTLLFMSMARYKSIPVKWQSGWMMHPGKINLHDWCEVYYEGVGWVPLDMSFSLQNSDNIKIKEFYITGIDSYRLIVNDAIGSAFFPPKKFLRSETWDFQRGELEWRGGNLYFDQWKYRLEVEKNQ